MNFLGQRFQKLERCRQTHRQARGQTRPNALLYVTVPGGNNIAAMCRLRFNKIQRLSLVLYMKHMCSNKLVRYRGQRVRI